MRQVYFEIRAPVTTLVILRRTIVIKPLNVVKAVDQAELSSYSEILSKI